MSVQNNITGGESVVLERPAAGGVYASLFEKINLSPVSELSALDIWQDAQAMSDATADERLTAGMQVFLECLTKAGSKIEKLDKSLIDHHIAELDYQISRQLDAVMHHEEFQAVESLWRGVKSLVDKTDFRQNVKIELLSMSKEDLRQDFEDSPEIVQSGLYKHTYIDEYDTPGGEPIAALISAYEFDASAQDVALLRNISKVSAAAPDAAGKTRIEPPRADQRAMLKRLYLQQSWLEILEHADSTFSRGANHLWLDLQWYIHQALVKLGQDVLADIITADLKGLLHRLTGLETLAFNDGTPFADEVTLNWINQSVLDDMSGWRDEPASAASGEINDILALEPEALEKADADGLDATLHWLQTRPGTDSAKDKWLLRLLMARIAEQKGKNELALHLLGELDSAAQSITLTQWTPALLFEVKSRRLRLLRMKATRSETDKSRLQPEMDLLLSGLIALDPASSAVLCG